MRLGDVNGGLAHVLHEECHRDHRRLDAVLTHARHAHTTLLMSVREWVWTKDENERRNKEMRGGSEKERENERERERGNEWSFRWSFDVPAGAHARPPAQT